MSRDPEEILRSAGQGLDERGFFRREDVSSIRGAVQSLAEANTPPDHPAQVFGPWDGLPKTAQESLRRLAEREISSVIRYHPRGWVWPKLPRALFSVSQYLEDRGRFPRLAGWSETWAGRTWTAAPKLREKILARSLLAAWERGGRVSAAGLLAALGRRPRWLLGDYLTAVRVDPRARGFFHDQARNVIWGYSVGIDLIPSPNGVWCVEANLNSGAYDYRDEEDWKTSRVEEKVERIVGFARDLGVENVWWYGADEVPIPPQLKLALEETARSMGLNMVVWEDYKIPSLPGFPPGMSPPRKRLTSPTEVPENTLLIRRNDYEVGSDWVVSDKEPFTRGLDSALRWAKDRRCRVPTMTLMPGDLPDLSDEGLPNLVYKYPGFAWGEAVYFMRVDNVSEALAIARRLDREVGNNPPGLFQPFVCSRLLPGRRVYDVRCEMLVTPLGANYSYAYQRESSKPIPKVLEEGLFPAKGVFTANISQGGTGGTVDLPEGDEVLEAAVAVGEGLVRLLSRGFVTTE
ncbi:hypothetical protein ACFL3S_12410 [Gemmatimonadota bacterium]